MNNTKPRTPVSVKRSFLFALSSLLLASCSGGSGSDSSKASEQAPSYAPSSERLLEDASSSKELYVEQDFDFGHSALTRLAISVNDVDGNSLPFTRVNVYLIDREGFDETPTEWSDEYMEHAQLLSGGLSNKQGEFVRVLELPIKQQSKPLLLIDVNSIGIENKALVIVENENTQITFGLI